MAQPVLVVDFGTWGTSAAVVAGGRASLLGEPTTGALRWPSVAFLDRAELLVGAAAQRRRDAMPLHYVDGVRAAVDTGEPVWLGERQVSGPQMLTAYLETIVAESERTQDVRIERLVLTVPSSYRIGDPRRDAMVTAAAAAGFPDVELVSDSAAAVLDPQIGADFPDGSLVLVCDLGATWTVTLVRAHANAVVQISEDSSRGGRDFDLMLMSDLRAELREWIEPILATGGDDGSRLYYAAGDFVRRLKHELDDADEVLDRIAPGAPPYRLDRAGLERFAEPGLRWLLGSCRAQLARAGESVSQVSAVVLLGGGSRLPLARSILQSGLGRPVRHAPDPELAVIRGAARWATGGADRRVSAQRPAWRVEPLCWDLPEAGGRLLRWLVAEHESYPAEAVLAQVRTADDRVYDLTAPRKGVLLERRVAPGAPVPPGAVLGTSRFHTAMATSPVKRYELHVPGEWLLTPDRRTLIEAADNGSHVRIRSVSNGAVLNELRPVHDATAGWARVFRSPAGNLSQVTCDASGRFDVMDVVTGRRTATFRESGPVRLALVDEARWRLVAESGRQVQAGRYRRDVATVWDLATGARVEELVGEDLHRLYSGYADRTVANGFAAQMYSPDGCLLTVAEVGSASSAANVSLQEAETGQELFRVERPEADWVRAAIDADGRCLLAYWRSGDTGSVEVWEI
ncbi:MAG TPA: Hsp70 family protein [Micromonosporaceae bacterium]|nr:Hsp70 family protein [Micromonosporaceae bacterium]